VQNCQPINIVWIKRDLRTQDHAPLQAAEQVGLPYFIIYIFEPSIIQYPDTSERHLQFQYHSITQLNKKLANYNRQVTLFYAEALEAFQEIAEQYNIQTIFSYQESGTQITYNRDKAVKLFCKTNQIEWKEFQRDGIIRGIRNRKDWDKNWYATMHSPIIQNSFSQSTFPVLKRFSPSPKNSNKSLVNTPLNFNLPGKSMLSSISKALLQSEG
jgi:deoxyribodipyrimidine photo-lyase